jgi:trans-aconitate methyltransferase
MLTKRTNILFDKATFGYLKNLAKKEKTSVGELVRKAVITVYFKKNFNQKKIKAMEKIVDLRKKIKKISLKEIREFIDYGRK